MNDWQLSAYKFYYCTSEYNLVQRSFETVVIEAIINFI